MYAANLAPGGVVPAQVIVGGQLAQILYFGAAPGYPGYFQITFFCAETPEMRFYNFLSQDFLMFLGGPAWIRTVDLFPGSIVNVDITASSVIRKSKSCAVTSWRAQPLSARRFGPVCLSSERVRSGIQTPPTARLDG